MDVAYFFQFTDLRHTENESVLKVSFVSVNFVQEPAPCENQKPP